MFSRPLLTAVTALTVAAALTAACSGSPATAQRAAESSGVTATAPSRAPAAKHRMPGVAGTTVEVVAVGDIACPPGSTVTEQACRQADTAELTKGIDPDAVLALGDLQYDTGALHAFRHSYAQSWGDLKGITYPTPGNHEYRTEDAAGYYTYFRNRQPGAPGYYTTRLGSWRVYVLNGNCAEISCKRERGWLRRDLEAHPRPCSLIATHFPRYSTGEHGSDTSMKPFFRLALRHDVDVYLAGHDHHYERFARMNNRGQLRKHGVMQFVSGGGGKSHYAATGDIPGSAYAEDDTYGVLRLVLRPDSFRFGFRGVDGSRQDNGTRSCV